MSNVLRSLIICITTASMVQLPPAASAQLALSGPSNPPASRAVQDTFKPVASTSDEAVAAAARLPMALIPMTKNSNASENTALISVLNAYGRQTDHEDVGSLREFCKRYPESRWRASLECNLGEISFETGYFSYALNDWRSAWRLSKDATDLAQRGVADESISRFLYLLAGLGRVDELRNGLAEIETRPLYGSVEAKVASLKHSLDSMLKRPDHSFKCGPAALMKLALLEGRSKLDAATSFRKFPSTQQGTSLASLEKHAQAEGLDFEAVRKVPGTPIPVPCIVHFALGHFAAITAVQDGKYIVEDPTFTQEGVLRVSRNAIETESDGYFLVRRAQVSDSLVQISDKEAASVFGKGKAPEERPNDLKTPANPAIPCEPCRTGGGMPNAGVFPMQATHKITDFPLSYQPAVGMPISFGANYNYKEGHQPQPGQFDFSNFGPNWSFNWNSYVESDGSTTMSPTVVVRGGGAEAYHVQAPSASGIYWHDVYSQALLTRTPSSGVATSYQRLLPDGSVETFQTFDTTLTTSSKWFLRSVTDPQGLQTTINYQTSGNVHRISSIVDPFGLVTTLSYGSDTFTTGQNAYLAITRITDPFGRYAEFSYDSQFITLLAITDQLGLKTKFDYGNSAEPSYISAYTTPYGITSFKKYLPPATPGQFDEYPLGLEVTLPDKSRMRVENFAGETISTFFWDREAMSRYPNDSSTGNRTHCATTKWVLRDPGFVLTAIPIWKQNALDYRTYFEYEGITRTTTGSTETDHYWFDPNADPTISKPTKIMIVPRGTENIATATIYQTTTFAYDLNTPSQTRINSFGYPRIIKDSLTPNPRWFDFTYAANNIDLVQIRQHDTGEYLGQWTYNTLHMPTKFIDGAGSSWDNTFNQFGQLLTAKNALSAQNPTTIKYATQPVNVNAAVVGATLMITANTGTPHSVSYQVPSGKTTAAIAAALASAVNGDATFQSAGIIASSVGSTVMVTSLMNRSVSYSVSGSGLALAASTVGPIASIDGPLSGSADITLIGYDALFRPISIIDSENYALNFSFDNADRLISTTFPDGTKEEVVFDRLDAVISKDRNGLWTQVSYDSLRQPIHQIDPAGRKTSFEWCDCGSIMNLFDAKGNKTTFTRDLVGRVTAKTFADGSQIQYTFDGFGRLHTKTDAKGAVTTLSYNTDNRVAGIVYSGTANPSPTNTNPCPNVSLGWDQHFARVTSVATTVPNLASYPTSLNEYTFNSNITSATGTASGGGQLAQETKKADAASPVDWTIVYGYDAINRLTSRSIDSVQVTWALDAINRLLTEQRPGHSTQFIYVGQLSGEGSRNLALINHANGTSTSFAYGAQPNLSDWRPLLISHRARDGVLFGQFDYTFDPAGRIVVWRQQQNSTDLYTQFNYDFSNQLTAAKTSASSVSPPFVSQQYFDYDCVGNRTSLQSSATIGQPTSVLKADFNCLNQPTSTGAGGTVRVEGSVDRAVNKVMVNDREALQSTTKTFSTNASVAGATTGDTSNSLTVQAFTDAGGNPLQSKTVVVAPAATSLLSHDANGNLTSDGVDTYKFDAENRLAEIDYQTAGDVTNIYYDGLGRQLRITEAGSVSSTKNFVWSGLQRCQERNAANAVQKYFYALTTQVPSDRYIYAVDHLGSVREVTNSSGTLTARYSYSPFGEQTKIAGTGPDADFGFAGMYVHARSGLNLTMFRAYSPQLGRWLSRDPLGEGSDATLYSYAGNNPVNFVDPLGLFYQVVRNGTSNGVQNVTINAPLTYPANASAADVSQQIDAINNQWTGQFGNINLTMHAFQSSSNQNVIDFSNTGTKTTAFVPPPGTQSIANGTPMSGLECHGHWNPKSGGRVPHEFGHLLGLGHTDGDLGNLMGPNMFANGISPAQVQRVVNGSPWPAANK